MTLINNLSNFGVLFILLISNQNQSWQIHFFFYNFNLANRPRKFIMLPLGYERSHAKSDLFIGIIADIERPK